MKDGVQITEQQLIEGDMFETLFKAEMPITRLKEGFGFIGIVIRDKTVDSLQCHTCGRWVKHLSSHVYNSHKMKSKEYRMKYELPLCFPLVSKAISEAISLRNIEAQLIKNLGTSWVKQAYKKGMKRHNNNAKYARNNASFHNRRGICEKQLAERYIIVADMVGRNPTEKDIYQYDSKLIEMIKNRHGNINTFRKLHGFETNPGNKDKEWTVSKIIACIRKFIQDNERFPNYKDLYKSQSGFPSYSTLVRKCGSINRTIALAGYTLNA